MSENFLFPAFQKFYSALSQLERFSVENDFFDNISSIDSFFAEYRNVTFVIQKSIGHDEEKKEIYTANRDEYLKAGTWFVDKRNEVTKEKPFDLRKSIRIYKYSPDNGKLMSENNYEVGQDCILSDCLEQVKRDLNETDEKEIFFSIKFEFFEGTKTEELFSKILPGLTAMYKFLMKLNLDYHLELGEIKGLISKIESTMAKISAIDMVHNLDYVYYPIDGLFERANPMSFIPAGGKEANRIPLSSFLSKMKTHGDIFDKIMLLNVAIGSADLMPTFFLLFSDNTLQIDTFHSSIKTTFYRKINEVADLVSKGNVKEVYFMVTYSVIDWQSGIESYKSNERIRQSKFDMLAFFRVSKTKQEECIFDGRNIRDMRYVAYVLQNGRKDTLHQGANNMRPVIEAFEKMKG